MVKARIIALAGMVAALGAIPGPGLTQTTAAQQYQIIYRAYTVAAEHPNLQEVRALKQGGDSQALMSALWGGLDGPFAEDAQGSDEALLTQLQTAMPGATMELVGKAMATAGEGEVVMLDPWAEPEKSLTCFVKAWTGEDGKLLVGTHYEGRIDPWFCGPCNSIDLGVPWEAGMACHGVFQFGVNSLPPGHPRRFIQYITVRPLGGDDR